MSDETGLLELSIQVDDHRPHRPVLRFRLRMPGSIAAEDLGQTDLSSPPAEQARDLLALLGGLDASSGDAPAVAGHRMAAVGRRLLELVPVGLRRRLWELREGGRPLRIASDDPFIPWELAGLSNPESSADPPVFLVEAFAVTRWLTQAPREERSLPLRRIGLIARLDGDEERAAHRERDEVRSLAAPQTGRAVRDIPARLPEVLAALVAGELDGLHFVGHGSVAGENPDTWGISLEAGTFLTPLDLAPLDLRQSPLVLFNACQTGRLGRGMTGIGGWPAGFLAAGAGAFLGAWWDIPGEPARRFAAEFYARFLGGLPIGEAVRQARLEVRKVFPGDPTWLAYTVFAHPLARCRETAAAAADGAAPDPSPESVERLWAQRRTGRAWSGSKAYSRLGQQLAEADGARYRDLALALIGWVLLPPGQLLRQDFAWADENLAYLPAPARSPLAVHFVRFPADSQDRAELLWRHCRAALEAFRGSGLRARNYLLVHNGEPRSEMFRRNLDEALAGLGADLGLERAEAWGRQRLLKEAFSAAAEQVLALAGSGRLSPPALSETLDLPRDEPLAQVPLRRSLLVADQHHLRGEEESSLLVADPNAHLLAASQERLHLLLGHFGFGKTTAVIRVLRRKSDLHVLYAAGAALDEQVRGTKDLLLRCLDERVLSGFPEPERELYSRLLRAALDYAVKDPKQPLALVLDGLDESAFLGRPGGFHELFNSLWEVRIPIVLTMRTEFWQSQRAEFEAVAGKTAPHGERRVQRIRCVELLPWGPEQIRLFVERFQAAAAEPAARARLGELLALLDDGFERLYGDIPKRPLFLRMIAESVAASGLPAERVGRAGLLRDWARKKVWRDLEAPRAAGGEGRLPLLGEDRTAVRTVEIAEEAMKWAAFLMVRPFEGALELTADCGFEALRQAAEPLCEIREPLALALHSLLRPIEERRGQPVRLGFAHRAYQEFFLAWFLLEHPDKAAGLTVPEAVADWMRDIRAEGWAGGAVAPPLPSFPNERVRALAEQLEEARARLEERTVAGGDTTPVRAEILALRRELREGGRLQAGDALHEGRFRLLEPLGSGGFATVWKTYDRREQKLVAVKVLHGAHGEDRSRRERFFRGAAKMARLRHPGIVGVLEPELAEGPFHYFVMEYVEGGDLRQAVLAGRLPPERVLPVIVAVGEALAYAHEQGLIHRDVKPANVLLGPAGPKLTDFDLVRVVDSTGGTRSQSMLGSFLYAAPEALDAAKDAGVAADIYSLAMTAVFGLYGRDLPLDVLRHPEPVLAGLACAEGARDVLRRALAWDPAERPPSVEELCRRLEKAAGGPSPGDERVHGKDGSVLVFVPGGEYVQGTDDLSERERPVHRVTLSPFWIGKHPVTCQQYAAFLAVHPEHERPLDWEDERIYLTRPVGGVSWEDARAYCAWAGLALPSEAQWEAAILGTVGSGDVLEQIGHGWEWCEDVWDPEAYRARGDLKDPLSSRGDSTIRSLRGGAGAGQFLAARRDWVRAKDRDGSIGFRVCLPATAGP